MAKPKPIAPKKAAVRKRILIVDDHPLMREGMRGAINHEPDLMVCGEAGSARQALSAIQKLAPDMALVDITLPGESGLELVKDIKANHPRVVILAISMHDESLYAEPMLHAGASGYITKQQPPEELIKAIRQVLDNGVYVSKQVSQKLLQRFYRKPEASQSPMSILTDREFEVFQLIGQGKSLQEIARQLHIASQTAAVHSANIRQKLNLRTSAQLVRFAVQSEAIKPPAGD